MTLSAVIFSYIKARVNVLIYDTLLKHKHILKHPITKANKVSVFKCFNIQ